MFLFGGFILAYLNKEYLIDMIITGITIIIIALIFTCTSIIIFYQNEKKEPKIIRKIKEDLKNKEKG